MSIFDNFNNADAWRVNDAGMIGVIARESGGAVPAALPEIPEQRLRGWTQDRYSRAVAAWVAGQPAIVDGAGCPAT